MRNIVNYLKNLFCKHEFEYEQAEQYKRTNNGEKYRHNILVSRTCKKCGWHKSYEKFSVKSLI